MLLLGAPRYVIIQLSYIFRRYIDRPRLGGAWKVPGARGMWVSLTPMYKVLLNFRCLGCYVELKLGLSLAGI